MPLRKALAAAKAFVVGRPVHRQRTLRRLLHGVVYLVRTGIFWWDLPARFGHWNSVFRRFRCRYRTEVWTCMRAAVPEARANLARVHPSRTLPPGSSLGGIRAGWVDVLA